MRKYYCVYIITNPANYEDVSLAIAREKQIKAGSRRKKIGLINNLNPQWKNLYETLD